MSSLPAKPMNLQWNQSDTYWLGVICRQPISAHAEQELKSLGMQQGPLLDTGTWLKPVPRQWGGAWSEVYELLKKQKLTEDVDVAVGPGALPPDAAQLQMARAGVEKVQGIAASLWLGEALMNNHLLCYLQPVVSGKDKIFGYESFARARQPDGKVIGGGAIVAAARALGIEYAIDRQLQIQAIRTFVESDRSGSLFINFFPGFIQRPDVYLEGLTEAVRAQGVVPKHIVLDVTKSDNPHHLNQLKRVSEYCQSKGYAVALDDIESSANIKTMLSEVHPDYVKLDMHLAQKVLQPGARDTIRQITEICHARGVLVIAEGVETDEIFSGLKSLEVDLFQGYLFAPPLPPENLASGKAEGKPH